MATPLITAIALDLGTTSIKAGLLDQHGELCHITALPAPNITEQHGCYESDALAYAVIAEQVLEQCLKQTNINPPLGLCSQRSSFLIWEKSSGQAITPLISWQDNRGAATCLALRGQENIIRDLTGLRLTPYYFAPKLRIVLQEHPQWRERLMRGELLVGTLDTFMIWRWTGGKHHVSDASMTARTLLLDMHQLQWSRTLCDLFDIPFNCLPQIKPSVGMNLQLNNGLTLQASLGDQSAALIAGVAKNGAEALVNLGTGGFVIRYLPKEAPEKIYSTGDYLRTLVYQDENLCAHIAVEGTLNSIAAALAPYPINECRVEDLAAHYIFCLAEPSGIGSPYFRNDWGIHFSEPITHLTPHQIAILLLEGIIFRVARILENFHRESALDRVYLSGGLSESACLQQGLALCLTMPIYRLPQKDSSLQGAALCASEMADNHQHVGVEILKVCHSNALPEKYKLWKVWFDHMLNN